MKLLIDTHIFLWWDSRAPLDHRLSRAIRDPKNEVFVSAASVWEIAIKRRLGKLTFDREIGPALAQNGFLELSISIRHAERAGILPDHHRDPFDRMLVAQAQLEQMVLGSQDPKVWLYDVPLLGRD